MIHSRTWSNFKISADKKLFIDVNRPVDSYLTHENPVLLLIRVKKTTIKVRTSAFEIRFLVSAKLALAAAAAVVETCARILHTLSHKL